MTARLLLLLTVLAATACQPEVRPTQRRAAGSPVRAAEPPEAARRRYVAARPQLSPDVRAAILEGRLVPGMRTADVRCVLGPGARIEVQRDEGERHAHEEWALRRSPSAPVHAYLTFVDGELVSIQSVR